MSSKTDTPIGSQYGSLDVTETKLQAKADSIKSTVSESTSPPKPAVRQRTLHKVNNKSIQSLKISNKQPEQFNDNAPDAETSIERQMPEANTCKSKQRESSDLLGLDAESKQKCEQNLIDNGANLERQKGALTLPLPTDLQKARDRPYPKKVLFIVANEFCERFSFYGLRTIFVLYFRSVLAFSDANAAVSYHLFTSLCYLTPILGAILGDSVLGKFKTILYLSIVYFLGELVLVIGSVFWNQGSITIGITFFGLFLIGLGTGGIKPCVSALGGDQFLPHEDKWRQSFFSLFYAAINLGSFIAMFLTPMLRSDFHCANRSDCYPLAFGVPCLLMLTAIVIFLMAKNKYHLVALPEKNVIVEFSQCVWLALKRKFTCKRLASPNRGQINPSFSENTSSSSLSVSSNEDSLVVTKRYSDLNRISTTTSNLNSKVKLDMLPINESSSNNRNHWLYLASDQFDTKSIEQFRCVLGIFLLLLPLPVYWTLFDQQGSLWTLQASRMDGRLLGTNFVLEPDQMSVANPIIMLGLIPVFEIFVYPSLTRCNLLTKPIQRMTVGGVFAAAAFVLSALIEMRIQQFHPLSSPPTGKANLMLVNGLSECSMNNPVISYVQIPGIEVIFGEENKTGISTYNVQHSFEMLKPMSTEQVNLLSTNASLLNNYKLKFTLSNSNEGLEQQSSANISQPVGCPFSSQMEHEFSFAPLADRSANLLYLEQGNGKLTYKLFNDSLDLPVAGKARVRLLYESFGSLAQTEKRLFSLIHSSSSTNLTTSNLIQFRPQSRDGQVLISDYLDIDVPTKGDTFVLRTNDNLIDSSSAAGKYAIELKPGTRNLIIVNQRDAKTVEVKVEVLQDNEYRISMLYQMAPYLLISISEVMFSITGLEFSYSMAPENMKSVILGAWLSTISIGNILTAAVESMHFFSNVANDFLFYAAIMTIDIMLFAMIGHRYKAQQAN